MRLLRQTPWLECAYQLIGMNNSVEYVDVTIRMAHNWRHHTLRAPVHRLQSAGNAATTSHTRKCSPSARSSVKRGGLRPAKYVSSLDVAPGGGDCCVGSAMFGLTASFVHGLQRENDAHNHFSLFCLFCCLSFLFAMSL